MQLSPSASFINTVLQQGVECDAAANEAVARPASARNTPLKWGVNEIRLFATPRVKYPG
jgi:hypothetical protein